MHKGENTCDCGDPDTQRCVALGCARKREIPASRRVSVTFRPIDLEAYCVGCGSDQHTALEPAKHPSMRWCGVCWNWQKPLSSNLVNYIMALEAAVQERG